MSGPEEILTLEYARQQDKIDPLRKFRDEFLIPTKAELKRKKLGEQVDKDGSSEISTYLCGNSLGVQPKRTRKYIESYLTTWSSMGVYGHFKPLDDELTVPWVDIATEHWLF